MAVRDVARELSEFADIAAPPDELAEALRRMDANDKIQFNERNQTIFVRSSIAS